MTHVLVPRRSAAPARRVRTFGFHGELGRVFDEIWGGFGLPVSHVRRPHVLAPRMDFSETDEEIRIAAELPGLEETDIEVGLNDGVLTIKGERADERDEEGDEKGYRHVETFRGQFQRAIRLPAEADEDAVKAVYKAGVLTVTLPKRPEVEPEVRTIPITAG
jgi:HSP20 family protein